MEALILRLSSLVPIFPVQWLKQIDSTEAALTQKMIDLENDKVKNLFKALTLRVVDKCSNRYLSDSSEDIMANQLAVILHHIL